MRWDVQWIPGSLPQVNEVWNSSFTKSLLGDCSSVRMRSGELHVGVSPC